MLPWPPPVSEDSSLRSARLAATRAAATAAAACISLTEPLAVAACLGAVEGARRSLRGCMLDSFNEHQLYKRPRPRRRGRRVLPRSASGRPCRFAWGCWEPPGSAPRETLGTRNGFHRLQHEFGLQRASELPVGGVESGSRPGSRLSRCRAANLRISPSISRGACCGNLPSTRTKATWYAKPNRLWGPRRRAICRRSALEEGGIANQRGRETSGVGDRHDPVRNKGAVLTKHFSSTEHNAFHAR